MALKYRCDGRGDNRAFGKLWYDRPRLEGQSVGECALLMTLRYASHTGPCLKSFEDEEGVLW